MAHFGYTGSAIFRLFYGFTSRAVGFGLLVEGQTPRISTAVQG